MHEIQFSHETQLLQDSLGIVHLALVLDGIVHLVLVLLRGAHYYSAQDFSLLCLEELLVQLSPLCLEELLAELFHLYFPAVLVDIFHLVSLVTSLDALVDTLQDVLEPSIQIIALVALHSMRLSVVHFLIHPIVVLDLMAHLAPENLLIVRLVLVKDLIVHLVVAPHLIQLSELDAQVISLIVIFIVLQHLIQVSALRASVLLDSMQQLILILYNF